MTLDLKAIVKYTKNNVYVARSENSFYNSRSCWFKICKTDCLLWVDDTECFQLGLKGQGQIYIKSCCMDCYANSSYIF